jgi:hypothetical protein
MIRQGNVGRVGKEIFAVSRYVVQDGIRNANAMRCNAVGLVKIRISPPPSPSSSPLFPHFYNPPPKNTQPKVQTDQRIQKSKKQKSTHKKQKQKRNDPKVWHCGETKRGGVKKKKKKT